MSGRLGPAPWEREVLTEVPKGLFWPWEHPDGSPMMLVREPETFFARTIKGYIDTNHTSGLNACSQCGGKYEEHVYANPGGLKRLPLCWPRSPEVKAALRLSERLQNLGLA